MKNITIKQIGIFTIAAIGIFIIYKKFIKKDNKNIGGKILGTPQSYQEEQEAQTEDVPLGFGGGGGGGIIPSTTPSDKKIEMTNLVLPTGGGTNVTVTNTQTVDKSDDEKPTKPKLPENPLIAKRPPLETEIKEKPTPEIINPINEETPVGALSTQTTTQPEKKTTLTTLTQKDAKVEKELLTTKPLIAKPFKKPEPIIVKPKPLLTNTQTSTKPFIQPAPTATKPFLPKQPITTTAVKERI